MNLPLSLGQFWHTCILPLSSLWEEPETWKPHLCYKHWHADLWALWLIGNPHRSVSATGFTCSQKLVHMFSFLGCYIVCVQRLSRIHSIMAAQLEPCAFSAYEDVCHKNTYAQRTGFIKLSALSETEKKLIIMRSDRSVQRLWRHNLWAPQETSAGQVWIPTEEVLWSTPSP